MDKETVPGGMAEFAKLQAKAGIGGRGRRSSLTRWMGVHHNDFAAMLADKKPGWDEVAAILAGMGLRDGGGKVPTGDRARKTWWGVQQAKAETVPRRSKVSASRLPAPSQLAPGVHLIPVLELGPVDAQQPRAPLGLHPEVPAGTAETSQDWLAADLIPALPAVVAYDTAADATHLILDQGGSDGLAHGSPPSEIAPMPSITEQGPPSAQADLGRVPEQVEALQTGPSMDIGPAAPALNPKAAKASPDSSPTSVASAPGSGNPAPQDPVVIAPGEKQSRFRLSSFWKKPV